MTVQMLCTPTAVRNGDPIVSAGAATAALLLTPDPKEAWIAAGGTVSVTHDFGSAQPWDCAFLGFTTAVAGTVWSLHAGDTAAADTVVLAPRPIVEPVVELGTAGTAPRIVHLLARLPALVTSRYVRITVTQPDGAPALRAGILLLNASFVPTWSPELGGGRAPIDTGSRERLLGGGFGIGDGPVKESRQWTFGDLDDAEVDRLFALVRTRGERRPLIAVTDPEDTPGLQERICYGVLDRIEPYERRDTGKTRWAMRIESWQ